MSADMEDVNELAAKILPGMRERAQHHFEEMLKGTPKFSPAATVLVEVLLKTMSEELACIVIGLRK